MANFENYWKQTIERLVEDRSGLRAWLFSCYAVIVNLGIAVGWFVSLIVVIYMMVVSGLISVQTAAQIAITAMQVLVLVHLMYFSFSKRGEQLVLRIAEFLEEAIFPGTCIPAVTLVTKQFQIPEFYRSPFLPVPTTPPRSRRT